MRTEKLYNTSFDSIYILYLNKITKKNRTKEELDHVISWLTGYNINDFNKELTLKEFFINAPLINPNAYLITGVICGIRLEEIIDPIIKNIRYLDKLVDELAKGKKIDKILRQSI